MKGSKKVTDSEVENFARLANVPEEILRTIAMNRGWIRTTARSRRSRRTPRRRSPWRGDSCSGSTIAI